MEKVKHRLEKLKNQQAKLEARIKLMESRTKESERKKDMRRKILVGAFYLDKAKNENTLEELKNNMNIFLTRENDKKLFE